MSILGPGNVFMKDPCPFFGPARALVKDPCPFWFAGHIDCSSHAFEPTPHSDSGFGGHRPLLKDGPITRQKCRGGFLKVALV